MILYENRIIKFAYQVLCAVKAELNVFSLYQGHAWAWTLSRAEKAWHRM